MTRILICCLVLGVLAPSAMAICALPRPDFPGGKPVPDVPPSPGGGKPTTPGGGPRSGGGARRAFSFAPSWNIWWELNREYILGLRKVSITEDEPESGKTVADPVASIRSRVRNVLRKVAFNPAENDILRATALRSLGRAGSDRDARDFLRILTTPHQPPEVYEGAVLGLASLREIKDQELRVAVRTWFDRLLRGAFKLPDRAGQIAVLACGLRARDDETLVRSLGERLKRGGESADDCAAILFACGLSRSEFLTGELTQAVETGKLGRKNLHDIARAHGALALAMCGGGKAALPLAKLLVAKKVQVHTRRSTALALGLLLREGSVDGVSDKDLQRALLHCFEEEPDPLVKGYCAIAMGAATKPFLTGYLMKVLDKTGSPTVKPYAALALGLAARTLSLEDSTPIREFLIRRLPGTKNRELAGALSIAIGLARATEASDLLVKRVRSLKLMGAIRGPACQALGMLGDASPKILDLLRRVLNGKDHEAEVDAALGLGLLGVEGTGPLLARKLAETKASHVLIHLVVALSHYGRVDALDPLLAILKDRRRDYKTRESAASALGIILDRRSRDPLFEIDAYASPFGLTKATRELVRIY